MMQWDNIHQTGAVNVKRAPVMSKFIKRLSLQWNWLPRYKRITWKGINNTIWIPYEFRIIHLKLNYACFSNYWNKAEKMFNYEIPSVHMSEIFAVIMRYIFTTRRIFQKVKIFIEEISTESFEGRWPITQAAEIVPKRSPFH